MQRSEEYLRLVLSVISRLWQQHVRPRRQPPADAYVSWSDHHRLLGLTLQLAREAELVGAVPGGGCHLAGADDRTFLD